MLPESNVTCDGCESAHYMDNEEVYCRKYVDGLLYQIEANQQVIDYMKYLIEDFYNKVTTNKQFTIFSIHDTK